MLGEDWETDRSLFVVRYCPRCVEVEFGDEKRPVELGG
jgi:hypothetical protein